MKKVRTVLVGFAIVALAAACSKKSEDAEADESAGAEEPEAAEAEAEDVEAEGEAEEAPAFDKELADRGMAFMEEVAAAGAENIDDCDAVASEWRSLIDDNQDLLDEMTQQAAEQSAEEQAAFEEHYADRLSAFMDEMGKVIQACQGHEEITGLMQELSTQ